MVGEHPLEQGEHLALRDLGAFALDAQRRVTHDDVHRWKHGMVSGDVPKLAAGVREDIWTTGGDHFRVDGTRLGTLAFRGQPLDAIKIGTVFVDKGGFVYVTGEMPVDGIFLSRHTPDGAEIWRRHVGRPSKSGAVDLTIGVRSVDSQGKIYVAESLAGCADLGDDKHKVVRCATKANVYNPDSDAIPRLYLISQYRSDGSYASTLAFERQPPDAVAISSDGSIAVAARWTDSRDLTLKSPNGEAVRIAGLRHNTHKYSKVFLIVYRPDGHLQFKQEFGKPSEGYLVGLTYDSSDKLWILLITKPPLQATFPPDPTGSKPGPTMDGLSLLSINSSGAPTSVWTARFPEVGYAHAMSLDASRDGQLVVAGIYPASLPSPGRSKSSRPDRSCCVLALDANTLARYAVEYDAPQAVSVFKKTICHADGKDIECARFSHSPGREP